MPGSPGSGMPALHHALENAGGAAGRSSAAAANPERDAALAEQLVTR